MATYYTPAAPTITAGFFLQAESAIRVGTGNLYESLEHTSWAYQQYESSIGLKAGQSFEIGAVNDLTWAYEPEYEPVETYNLAANSVYQVTGEETRLTVEIFEFHPKTLEMALGTGSMYELGNERVYTYGVGCTMRSRPVSVEFTNGACDAPTSDNINNGISGGVLTIYDAFISAGLEWALAARENNTVSLEFTAKPVTARARGNRLGSLYLY
jgi:hypothetical protein